MKQSDLDILKTLKREEKLAKLANKPVRELEEVIEGMPFDMWWNNVAKVLKLQAYLKEVVWSDFKARGLSKNEPKEKYDAAMRLFGYAL